MTADTITLYASGGAHGVLETHTETQRQIYAAVTDVGMNETYAAHSAGLSPEISFIIAVREDYAGEKKAVFHGETYRVLRVAPHGSGVKLVCGRWDNDA